MYKILTAFLLLAPMAANAQDTFGINRLTTDQTGSNKLALGSRSLEATIARIINVILGFLGVIATLIILLGGFKWMTSQGNTDKVDEAKKLIGAGVVGLVIVLAAVAIANFVLRNLSDATQG